MAACIEGQCVLHATLLPSPTVCVCKRSSVVRSFRYVATLTAQRVVTSLVTATLLLGEARETAQRQLSAEKAKKGSKVRPGSPCALPLPQAHVPLGLSSILMLLDVSPSGSGCSGVAVLCCGWLVPTWPLWRVCMCQWCQRLSMQRPVFH